MSETQLDLTERAKIYWQCRRGMLELDVLLQTFFDAKIDTLNTSEVTQFKNLLDCADDQLLEYLMGRLIPTDPAIAHVVKQIRYATSHP